MKNPALALPSFRYFLFSRCAATLSNQMLMVIVANSKLMGLFKARTWLVVLGWFGTAIMNVAIIALSWSAFAG